MSKSKVIKNLVYVIANEIFVLQVTLKKHHTKILINFFSLQRIVGVVKTFKNYFRYQQQLFIQTMSFGANILNILKNLTAEHN